MKAKGHQRQPFSGRVRSGHRIDSAMRTGNVNEAVNLMRQSETALTLKRRKIGETLRGAKTDTKRKKAEAEMDEINDIMDDLCFHIRDPNGFFAKNK